MLTIASVVLASFLPQSDVKEIHGRTVDGAGKPLGGVTIAAFWTLQKEAWTPGNPVLATSDDQGSFAKKVLWGREPIAYFAITKDGTRGGIVMIDDASVATAQRFDLVPMATVTATFDFKECGTAVPLLVSLLVPPARTFIGQLNSTGEKVQFRLPPGEYALRTFSHEAKTFDRSFTVPAEVSSFDLGPLPISPSVIASHYGKEPPALGVTDARGVAKDFKLSDLKGKWVLLDFWGHW